MRIDLTDTNLQDVFSEALLSAIDEKKREELIKGALAHILERKSTGHFGGLSVTPLEDAFYSAASISCRELLVERLKDDEEWKKEVDVLFTEAWQKAIADNREDFIEKISRSMIDALSKMRD